MNKKSREVAFILLRKWQKKKSILDKDFASFFSLKEKDLRFVKEIVYGTIRRYFSLLYLYKKLIRKKPTFLRPRERLIFYMFFYQRCFMEKVPDYAMVNESVELAKKYARPFLVSFFNAALRKVTSEQSDLPEENLSIYYSFPKFFIALLLKQYDLPTTENILSVQNHFFLPMIRARNEIEKSEAALVYEGKSKVYQLEKDQSLTPFLKTASYYVQNITPVVLIEKLSQNFQPKKILDLCSAPGGKLLLSHDLFPKAILYANDISKRKIELLEENLKKYQIAAKVTISPGQSFKSTEKFDLIILDVPCSNSGVLHKRAEARWRITEKRLEQLNELQFQLIKNAYTFLEKGGQIWYMTCSILEDENEKMIERAAKEFRLEIVKTEKILPNMKGWDGGFACSLRKKVN